jgi:hypothetical protein
MGYLGCERRLARAARVKGRFMAEASRAIAFTLIVGGCKAEPGKKK